MGGVLGRQNAGVEELDISVNNAYRYPPKQGNYFSNHFIMGGEKFDTASPEMYLFGENMDLNFLGSRPAPFPYPAPTSTEPSKTLKALVNIRKESMRLVKVPEETNSLKSSEPVDRANSTAIQMSPATCEQQQSAEPQGFNIEFTFDCDVRCAITVMYFCIEESSSQGLVYVPRDPSMNSETFHYKRGANQQFSQSSHIFIPSQHIEQDLVYSFDREICPIVVHCVAEEGEEPRQSQATIAVIEKHSDGYVLKALKQKLFVHGLCYLLQEIYGIENKNSEVQKAGDEETDDNGAECVICMSDLRDTLILPCRHLCLCNCCADSLRYQANNCPICRAPFRALLQIKALQKNNSGNPAAIPPVEGEVVPPGYEAVSLIEALNGPSAAPPVQPNAPLYNEMYVRLPQNPVRGDSERSPGATAGNVEDSTTQTENTVINGNTLMRMSTLLAGQELLESEISIDEETQNTNLASNETGFAAKKKSHESKKHSRDKGRHLASKDSVKLVNETKKQSSSTGIGSPKLKNGESLASPRCPGKDLSSSKSDLEDDKANPPIADESDDDEALFEEAAKRKKMTGEEDSDEWKSNASEDEVHQMVNSKDSKSVSIPMNCLTPKSQTVAEDDSASGFAADPGAVNPIYSLPGDASASSASVDPAQTNESFKSSAGEESNPDEGDHGTTQQPSMPGTPLSHASAVSAAASDVSSNSANSSQALLFKESDVPNQVAPRMV